MEQGIEIIGQMDNTIDHTFESANRVYGVRGIAPTIPTCGGGGIQPKILEIGYLEKGTGKHQSNIVFDSDGLCPAICAGMAVKQQPTMHLEIVAIDDSYHSRDERIYKETSPTLRAENNFIKVAEIVAIDEQNDCVRNETFGTLTTDGSSPKHNNRVCEICAMRGRDKTNPNYRGSANENFEQTLEISKEGVCNTITTVQKDNLVLELDKPNETEKSLRAEQSRAEQSRAEQSRAA